MDVQAIKGLSNVFEAEYVADRWESWCGKTRWSEGIREVGRLGGMIRWYCGFPQSASAIPLCFTVIISPMEEVEGNRLKDIYHAIDILKEIK